MSRLALIACALMLGGCDSGPPTKTKSIRVGATNPFHDRLMTLSELNRSLALRRAVQDSGESCRKIERSGFQGDHQSLKMWNASCAGGLDYAVFIAPTGDVQVRKCSDATTLGLPECRIEANQSAER